jgi:antitoxin YefM
MITSTISYESLKQNLGSVFEAIENNKEAWLVTRKQHSDVMMIARDDYESLIETLHLLSSASNSNRLNEALEQDRNGEYKKVKF